MKFEMSRRCAPTRTTIRSFCTGALQRQCLRDATRGCCESGARVRRRQRLLQRQGRLHWFRGPVNQQSGTGRVVPIDREANCQEMQLFGIVTRVAGVRRTAVEWGWRQGTPPACRSHTARPGNVRDDRIEAFGNKATQNVSGVRRVAAPMPRTGQCRHGRRRKTTREGTPGPMNE